MDILNFISWVKKGVRYITTVPTDTQVLLPLAAKDMTRDDQWLTMALNADGLKPLYNTGNVTQATLITNAVTVNAFNGIVTTVTSTLAGATKTFFTVNNSNVLATSKVIVSLEYDEAATGFPIVTVADIVAGSFKVVITNAAAATALNAAMRVHFIIIA
jgi:hypothetical protein